jgi:M6 family metalloprotease-like protein
MQKFKVGVLASALLVPLTGLTPPSQAVPTNSAASQPIAQAPTTQRPALPHGAPVNPRPYTVTQPDGTEIQVQQFGDAASHGVRTVAQGATVVQGTDGVWRYATSLDTEGAAVASSAVVGEDVAPATAKGLAPVQIPHAQSSISSGGSALGSDPKLVILAEFNDVKGKTSQKKWAKKFFGKKSSVKHFYGKASYGKFTLTRASETSGGNNGVVGWVNTKMNHPNFGGNFQPGRVKMLKRAMTAAGKFINYKSYDKNGNGKLSASELHITVISAGYEASYTGDADDCGADVWGHKYRLVGKQAPSLDGVKVGGGGYMNFGELHCARSLNDEHPATIGIMAHELGHDLGWADLYDTDSSNGVGNGVGAWSLMASGSWLAASGRQPGTSPAYPDAFSKYYQGWVNPTRITASRSVNIPDAATKAKVYQLAANPGGVDWTFQKSSGTGEYFLIENRQRAGYDKALPGCGVIIYHIDETRTADNTANGNAARKLVDIEEATGTNPLDTSSYRGSGSDPWPGSTGNTLFGDATSPNSDFYNGAASGVGVTINTGNTCAGAIPATLVGP